MAKSPAAILFDEGGHAVGVVLDGSVYRIQMVAKVARASDGAYVNPATQETLAAIKDTDGVKKIVDALPTGDNRVGRIKITDDTYVLGIDAQNHAYVSGKSAPGSSPSTNPVLISGVDGGGLKRTFLTDATGKLQITMPAGGYAGQVEGRAANDAAPVGYPIWMAGWDGTYIRAVKTDTQGRVIIAPAGTTASYKGFSNGDVSLTTVTTAVIRRTTYTEPTTNAQRSVASASANDAAAGTGARQVKITYFDQTGAGPYTETVTLNGTTPVNTVATNICFIEKLEATSVGSTGSNVGIITLYGATAGGGGTVGTIAATDRQTFWAHHYVPTGLSCYITGIAVGHTGSVAGTQAVFFARSRTVGVATAPDVQVSDFLTAAGIQNTLVRNYGTPIVVAGPSRIVMWVTTSSSTTITYRAAFDFYDQTT